MGALDKDINQKMMAIRYCLLKSTLPFLEVHIENKRELAKTVTVITDIDVLGVSEDVSGKQRRVLFDCKTLNKTSAINRAFWAAGLMRYTRSEEAFVILRRKSVEAHRLTAKQVNVHLFSEKQFSNFAESVSIDFVTDYCYSTDINNWIKQAEVFGKNSEFHKFGQFLTGELPVEDDAVRGVRRLIAALHKGRGEFNPDKHEHASIFFQTLMMFSLLMARIVHELKTIVDFDSNQESFERVLNYYIWGGMDAFSRKQKLYQILQSSLNTDSTADDLELREWDRFVDLSRKLLDSPSSIFKCCFLLRELSFRCVSQHDNSKDAYVGGLFQQNNRLRQFVMIQAKYLIYAAQLPREFLELIDVTIDRVLETPKSQPS